MNFHSNSEKDKTVNLLQKDKLIYVSDDSQLSQPLTDNASTIEPKSHNSNNYLITDSSNHSTRDFDMNQDHMVSNSDKKYAFKENETKEIITTKSKIGLVKIGFWKILNVNPISRYNFQIERYNEEINRYGNMHLSTVPFHRLLSLIFDYYIFYLRILFGVFLIIGSQISKKYCLNFFYTYFQYYHMNGPIHSTSWNNEKQNNWIIIILSCLALTVTSLIFLYFFWIIFLPSIVILVLLYSSYYTTNNASKIKKSFYKNMVFDEEIDKSDKLNDYITINPDNTEEFLGYSYYTYLIFLYRKRDMTKPQQFMLIGNNYKNEENVIKNSLIKHLIFVVLLIVCKFIYFII